MTQTTTPKMKRCCRCGETKPSGEFFRNAARADGLGSACKACCGAAERERWRTPQMRQAVLARRRAIRAYLESLKARPCEDCGRSFPPRELHFHHRPGTVKLHNVSAMHRHSIAAIDAEVAKCDLLCASCHGKRHAADREATT
jgi:hypothetical protein